MNILNLLIITGQVIASAFFKPQLPNQLPMHWNFQGQIDSYMNKDQAVWFFPAISFFILVMYQILPKIDPKKDKYALFQKEWQIIKTTLLSFFAYMQAVVFYLSLHPQRSVIPLIFLGLGVLFIIMGNFLSKIRQNWFLGIKTPWTLESEDNWNKTHRYASWTFVLAGIITLTQAYFQWQTTFIVITALILAGILPMAYSFLLSQNKTHYMRWVHILLTILLMGVLLLT